MTDLTRITLLDVGDREYGESLLVETRSRRVLIDGAHQGDDRDEGTYRGIASQLRTLSGEQKVSVDLLVLSHAHSDHVGCLPELISSGVIEAEWALVPDPDLAWGRQPGSPAPDLPSPVRTALAGLREEDPAQETLADDQRLASFLEDAVTLESRYARMLSELAQRGTALVHHGRREDADLLAAFSTIGLEIIGPSLDQMFLTADLMGEAMDAIGQDAMVLVDALPDTDDGGIAMYRALRDTPGIDAPKSRPGNLVNLQSLSLAFDLEGRRAFFGGDMELADPETGNAQIRAEVAALRQRIRSRGPFAYAQLGHHGSGNASSISTLEELGSPRLVGMSAGRASDKHPSADVLGILARGSHQWVRTDRNGQVRIEARGVRGWTVRPARGSVSDPTPAGADAQAAQSTGALAPEPMRSPIGSLTGGAGVSTQVEQVVSHQGTAGEVEVSIRTSRPVRMTISFDAEAVTAQARPLGAPTEPTKSPTPVSDAVVVGGGGRRLPELLYVTDPARLAANIGASEAERVMTALRAAPGKVVEVDGGLGSVSLRSQLASELNSANGIVLVGGYDVIPSDVIDTLPPELARSLSRAGDADQFVVWTDDLYAQRPGADALPISRVPDGHSAEVLFRALSTQGPRAATASGVRNVNRPFAETVYGALNGRSALLISEPALAPQARGRLGGDTIYFMLHGYWRDATRLWGEAGGEYPEAVNLTSLEPRDGTVVFSGACWGALIVDVQAMRYNSAMPLGARGPSESIALAYIAGGASAFIGCTGSHYSPPRAPYRSAGAPIHLSFFTYRSAGRPPAEALAQAKRDYVAAMPHTLGSPGALAVEHKLVWQFTCLGLGW
jgi:beta-lactamase superfamily II metal-dependent hydrolase